MNVSHLFLLFTAVLLGLRHGIDWDHIAAITDITGSQENKQNSFFRGMTYALGHGAIIITLGLLAVLLGIKLPSWIDSVMEPFVGITLIALGIWLLLAVITQRSEMKLVSRWGLLLKGIQAVYHYFNHHPHPHQANDSTEAIGFKGAFGIGLLHGIGAETPTQLLIFVTAAGVGGALLGTLLVLSFVAGLLTSNAFITILSTLGFSSVKKNPKLYLGLGSISGAFSLIVGILFLLGRASVLPAILGG